MATIYIDSGADPRRVLEIARSVAESYGYLWEQDDAVSAIASEGGKPIRNKVGSMKLRLRLQVEGDALELKQETNGIVYTAGANTPYFQIRIARQARKLRKATAQALAASGLGA